MRQVSVFRNKLAIFAVFLSLPVVLPFAAEPDVPVAPGNDDSNTVELADTGNGNAADTVEPVKPAPTAGDASTQTAAATTNGMQVVRRPHLKFESDKTEQNFQKIINARAIVTTDLRVIRRLISQKQQELARLNEKLVSDFKMTPGGKYHYDSKTRTVYELADSSTNAAAGADSKVLTRFKNTRMADLFLKITNNRQQCVGQVQLLVEMAVEKEAELASLEETLAKRFKMSRNMNYEYDPATKTLYELSVSSNGDNQTRPVKQ